MEDNAAKKKHGDTEDVILKGNSDMREEEHEMVGGN
jgi:hypothetical protein